MGLLSLKLRILWIDILKISRSLVEVDLSSMDKVWVYFEYVNAGKELELVVEENMKDIETSLRCPFCPVSKKPEFACVMGTDQKAVADGEIKVYLVRPCARLSDSGKKKFSKVSVNLDSYLQNKNYNNLKSQNGNLSKFYEHTIYITVHQCWLNSRKVNFY